MARLIARRLVLIAAAVFPTASVAENTYSILGEGTTTCAEWAVQRKADPAQTLPEVAWVLGYLSAVSEIRKPNSENFIRRPESVSIDEWIDGHCRVNPRDIIHDAAWQLVQVLRSNAARKK